jgi:DNA-binding beta-propeller fold protein YncE
MHSSKFAVRSILIAFVLMLTGAAPALAASTNFAGYLPNQPWGIAVDAAGNVYTSNYDSNSVSKFSSTGTRLWTRSTRPTAGSGEGPRGIVVDSAGNVYTANYSSKDVSKITPAGDLTIFGSTAPNSPESLTIDSGGTVYTSNWENDTVTKIAPGDSPVHITVGDQPSGIAVDSGDNVYVAIAGADRVTRIATGQVGTLDIGYTGDEPHAIAIDSAGYVFTANNRPNTVSKITRFGGDGAESNTNWASTGTRPGGIVVDAAGNVYTANEGSNNVTKITPGTSSGASVIFGATGMSPRGIAIDSAGNVYTSNYSGNSITKITQVPEAPTSVSAASAVVAQSDVTWTAPTASGGAAITGYRVTSSPGGRTCTTTGVLSCTVTGLAPGTSYTFTVEAENSYGFSLASDASSSVTTPSTVPGAPTGVSATDAANGQSVVSWTAPADTGGASITGYTVTSSGGQTCSWTTGDLSCTVTGLTNGASYTFTVTATNAQGTGSASSASNSVTPVAPAVPAASTPPGAATTPGTTTAKAAAAKAGSTTSVTQLLGTSGLVAPKGATTRSTTSTPKVCKVTGQKVVFLTAGTCKGMLIVTPKKGKATKKPFTIVVTKAKRDGARASVRTAAAPCLVVGRNLNHVVGTGSSAAGPVAIVARLSRCSP